MVLVRLIKRTATGLLWRLFFRQNMCYKDLKGDPMKKLILCILMILFIICACGMLSKNEIVQGEIPAPIPTVTPMLISTTLTPISFTIVPSPTQIPEHYESSGLIAEYEFSNKELTLVNLSDNLPSDYFIQYSVSVGTDKEPWRITIYPQVPDAFFGSKQSSFTPDIKAVFNAQTSSQPKYDISSVFRVYMNNVQIQYELVPYITQGTPFFRFDFEVDDEIYNADETYIFRIEVGFKEDLEF